MILNQSYQHILKIYQICLLSKYLHISYINYNKLISWKKRFVGLEILLNRYLCLFVILYWKCRAKPYRWRFRSVHSRSARWLPPGSVSSERSSSKQIVSVRNTQYCPIWCHTLNLCFFPSIKITTCYVLKSKSNLTSLHNCCKLEEFYFDSDYVRFVWRENAWMNMHGKTAGTAVTG